MKHDDGYNPLNWNCHKEGRCYNIALRPKIEVFADCFPKKIAMSDIDGMVEINGHFLALEWKTSGAKMPTGQRIMFERFTQNSDKDIVIEVRGNAETMEVFYYRMFRSGVYEQMRPSSLEGVKDIMREWAGRAREK